MLEGKRRDLLTEGGLHVLGFGSDGQRKCALSLGFLLTLVVSTAALAQAPNYQSGGPFTEPVELCPGDDGVLNVGLDIQQVTHGVQAVDTTNNTIKTQQMTLRAYHLLDRGDTYKWKFCDGEKKTITNPMVPGPTFRLQRKDDKQEGSKFQMTLFNNLEPTTPGHDCNTVRDFNQTPAPQDGQCSADLFPEVPQTWPACFHKDNVTNFHYHGFHVSPQPHQDWVLLNLYPKGSPDVPADDLNAVGSYHYDLDRLPDTQAEGTHWYHPHKHGSTGLQVLNGMAGTFVIEGPFDDWLNGQYKDQGGLEDKVLVVQQIAQDVKFFGNELSGDPPSIEKDCSSGECVCKATVDFTPPQPSVNGTINPEITMAPGEIQRWRFIGATMQASAQLAIGFDANFEIRQIAQDGVQFAKENYVNQPLLDFYLFIDGKPDQVLTNYQLMPGNRGDFLVKAPPSVTQRTCFFHTQTLIGNVSEEVRQDIEARDRAAIQHLTAELPEAVRAEEEQAFISPPLLTVCVDPKLGQKSMAFPKAEDWPSLPDFLKNLPDPGNTTTVAFSMQGTSPGAPTNAFYIGDGQGNDVQYCPNCANHTLTLDKTVQWAITNDSSPQHPFHIHINPFQLLEQGSIVDGKQVPVEQYDPPIWQDTIALPSVNGCWGINAGPIWNNYDAQQKCPTVCQEQGTNWTWKGNWVTIKANEMSVCQCCTTNNSNGYVKIRQEPLDFTGEYVLHCHILGHEDRGMMQNVQTVCENGQFGKPKPGQNECVEGNYIAAAPQCPASYPTDPNCPGS